MTPRASSPSWLRWPTSAALLVAAAAHIPVTPEHLREAPYMGWLFVGFTAVAAITAAVVAVRGRATAPFLAAAALCAAAVVAYALTRLIAFPQLSDDVGNWGEPLGIVSIISETAVVVLSLASAVRLRQRHARLA
jgi:apolipoprotein N-acyltransferase